MFNESVIGTTAHVTSDIKSNLSQLLVKLLMWHRYQVYDESIIRESGHVTCNIKSWLIDTLPQKLEATGKRVRTVWKQAAARPLIALSGIWLARVPEQISLYHTRLDSTSNILVTVPWRQHIIYCLLGRLLKGEDRLILDRYLWTVWHVIRIFSI